MMLTVDSAGLAAADAALRAAHGTVQGAADPYPHYARIRRLAPLYRSELDGIWYVTTYAGVKALLADPRASVGVALARYGVSQAATAQMNGRRGTNMLTTNAPEHTRLRALANKAFTPRRVQELRASIHRVAQPLVEALGRGEVDVMRALAFPLPVSVIGELVGVPAADHDRLRGAWQATFAVSAPGAGPEMLAASDAAQAFLSDYFIDLIAAKRARPGDDLLSGLIAARDENGSLTETELRETLRVLYLAGFVTTTGLIGNGLHALLRHRNQQRRLWADPALIPAAVEEMLRYDTPVTVIRRLVTEPIVLDGTPLEPGADLALLLPAANRDPARFTDPDTFDICRADNGPLSFGWGMHHCIGAPLARLEMQIVLELMIDRFAGIESAVPDLPHPVTSWFTRGPISLPVRMSEIPGRGLRR